MTLGLLADAANTTSNRKLNILGVFSNIYVRAFPAAHPMMNVVIRFSVDPAEQGQKKKMEVRLLGPDAEQLARIEAEFAVPVLSNGEVLSDVQTVIPLANLPFLREGPHAFHVLVNGDAKGRIAFNVVHRKADDEEVGEG